MVFFLAVINNFVLLELKLEMFTPFFSFITLSLFVFECSLPPLEYTESITWSS